MICIHCFWIIQLKKTKTFAIIRTSIQIWRWCPSMLQTLLYGYLCHNKSVVISWRCRGKWCLFIAWNIQLEKRKNIAVILTYIQLEDNVRPCYKRYSVLTLVLGKLLQCIVSLNGFSLCWIFVHGWNTMRATQWPCLIVLCWSISYKRLLQTWGHFDMHSLLEEYLMIVLCKSNLSGWVTSSAWASIRWGTGGHVPPTFWRVGDTISNFPPRFEEWRT